MFDMATDDLLTHSYVYGEPVRVSVAGLIQTLRGSVDACNAKDWFCYIANEKLGDEQMGFLIDSVLNEGMACPLNVVSQYNGTGPVMGNGNHRLLAAAFCGVEYIDVYVTDWIDWDGSQTDHEDEVSWIEKEECQNAYADGINSIWEEVHAIMVNEWS